MKFIKHCGLFVRGLKAAPELKINHDAREETNKSLRVRDG